MRFGLSQALRPMPLLRRRGIVSLASHRMHACPARLARCHAEVMPAGSVMPRSGRSHCLARPVVRVHGSRPRPVGMRHVMRNPMAPHRVKAEASPGMTAKCMAHGMVSAAAMPATSATTARVRRLDGSARKKQKAGSSDFGKAENFHSFAPGRKPPTRQSPSTTSGCAEKKFHPGSRAHR